MRRTLYHVLAKGKAKTSRTTFQGAYGSKADALTIAKGYKAGHPNSLVAVFRSTRLSVLGKQPRPRRGRIARG
jgi:hypothetical protein